MDHDGAGLWPPNGALVWGGGLGVPSPLPWSWSTPVPSKLQEARPLGPAPAMNGLSVTELCCLFCCPPCPGRIAAKLAFLPPEPTYSLLPEPEPASGGSSTVSVGSQRALPGSNSGRWKLHLLERADFQYGQRELDTIEVFVTKSSRGNRVACMYVRCVPGAR